MSLMPLDDLITALDDYVDPNRIPDFAPTGLQVRGTKAPVVTKVALGVSANLALFHDAAAWGAELVLTHHGMFWEVEDPERDPARRFDEARAAFLHERGMSLAAYHLPLDAHPEVGNNAELARLLGLEVVGFDFGDLPESTVKVGLTARARPPVARDELVARAEQVVGGPVQLIAGGSETIRTAAIVSGGGTGELYEAIGRGLDLYLTGEGREWAPAVAREAGINFLAVGHHASEVFGVQALGRVIETRFGLQTRFFPQENPF